MTGSSAFPNASGAAPRPSWSSLAGAGAWTFYLLLPVPGWGLFPGRPLGPIGTTALVLVWWAWLLHRDVPLKRAVTVLIAVKMLIGGALLADRGFLAVYYANDDWRGHPERSLDFLTLAGTRVDDRLRFDPRRHPFPLFFFNDIQRFNYRADEPQRIHLPFSVVWSGHFLAPTAGIRRFYLQAPAHRSPSSTPVTASLTVDGRVVVTLTTGVMRADGEVELARGAHPIEVRYRSPYEGPRRFSAGEVRDERDWPLDGRTVYVQAAGWRITADRLVRALSEFLDLALAAGLVFTIARILRRCVERLRSRAVPLRPRADALSVVALAAIAYIAWRAAPLAGVPIILTGGDDWLTHESFARDIVLNGPLMTLGRSIGSAAPFSTQPLYPYFVALVHLVTGEDFWGVFVVQQLLFAGMIWAAFQLTVAMFGRLEGWLALALGLYFTSIVSIAQRPPHMMEFLLGESLFLPLLAFWALALVRVATSGRPALAAMAGAGLLGGMAVVTRSPLLLALPPIWAVLAWSRWRRWRRASLLPLALFTCCLVAPIGMATLRNGIASGQWVIVSNAGPINFYLGNKPPPKIDVRRAETRPIYRHLGLDPLVAQVAEYAIQAPGAFARGLLDKALYVLGLREWAAEPRLFVLLWGSGLAGITLLVTAGADAAAIRLLPAIIAACHLLIMIIIGNFTYRYRLVYPMYLMLIPYSAGALARLARPRRAGSNPVSPGARAGENMCEKSC